MRGEFEISQNSYVAHVLPPKHRGQNQPLNWMSDRCNPYGMKLSTLEQITGSPGCLLVLAGLRRRAFLGASAVATRTGMARSEVRRIAGWLAAVGLVATRSWRRGVRYRPVLGHPDYARLEPVLQLLADLPLDTRKPLAKLICRRPVQRLLIAMRGIGQGRSIRELAAQARMGRKEVRRALGALERMGVIRRRLRRPGGVSLVSSHPLYRLYRHVLKHVLDALEPSPKRADETMRSRLPEAFSVGLLIDVHAYPVITGRPQFAIIPASAIKSTVPLGPTHAIRYSDPNRDDTAGVALVLPSGLSWLETAQATTLLRKLASRPQRSET